jgi:hypothetical protein
MLQQLRVYVSTPDTATVPLKRTTIIYKSSFTITEHCIIYVADKQTLNQKTQAVIPPHMVQYKRHETTQSHVRVSTQRAVTVGMTILMDFGMVVSASPVWQVTQL